MNGSPPCTIKDMRVRVYYNLHKHTFSIQHRTSKGWRVRDYADTVRLTDVTFKVSEAGRQRVLREGRKNVHAFVIGTLADTVPDTPHRVTYNPFKAPTFVRADDGEPVTEAPVAVLHHKQVSIA